MNSFFGFFLLSIVSLLFHVRQNLSVIKNLLRGLNFR